MYQLILNTGGGFRIPANEQILFMKQAGWEGFFTDWERGYDLCAFAKQASDLDMTYQSVHAPYHRTHYLWEEPFEGKDALAEILECMDATKDAGVDLMVMHAIIGMDRCTPTLLGLQRYEKIFDHAEQIGLKVALENTEGEVYLDALMDEFGNRDCVGFCIDTGHELCYNGKRDLIDKYQPKLVSTHLNDNLGQRNEQITWHDDLHLLPFDGIADWEGIARRLLCAGYRGEFTFELKTSEHYAELDYLAYITEAKARAERLRTLFYELQGGKG